MDPDTLNAVRKRIEIVLSKLDFTTEKINHLDISLKKKRDSIEQKTHILFRHSELELIGSLNTNFYYKQERVHALLKTIQSQKIDLLNFAYCLKHEQNDPTIMDKIERKLSEAEVSEAMLLEPYEVLEVVFRDHFEVAQNIGYIKTSTLSPKDMSFFVMTKSLSPDIHPNDTVYIKVTSNKAYDTFVFSSLSCKICSPDKVYRIILGEDLKDNSYQFKYLADLPGKHLLRILLYDVDIAGSPTFFKVSNHLKNPNKPLRIDNLLTDIPCHTTDLQDRYNILQLDQLPTDLSFPDNPLISNFNEKKDILSAKTLQNYSQTSSVHIPVSSVFPKVENKLQILCEMPENKEKLLPSAKTETKGSCDTTNVSCNDKRDAVSSATLFVNSSSPPPSSKLLSPKKENIHDMLSLNDFTTFPSPSPDVDTCNIVPEDMIFWSHQKGWQMTGTNVVAHFLWQSNQQVNLRFPIGVSSTPEDKIVVCDTGNHRIVILDSSGDCTVCFGKEGYQEGEFRRPSAVVVYPDGKIAVKDDTRIQLFSSNGEFLSTCCNMPFSKIYGLALDDFGNLITLDVKNLYLCKFNVHGEEIEKVLFQPLMPTPPLKSKCRFIDSREQQVVVVDLGLNCVYKINSSGELLKQFGSRGRRQGEFKDAAGVSADGKNNLFIADSKNNRIQVFTFNGDYLTTVKFKKPIHRPSDIYLTKTGKLLVLNYVDHLVSTYSLECY